MNKLITKSLQEKTLKYLLAFPETIQTEADKKFIGWIKEYSRKYYDLPTVERLIENFNGMFVPVESDDPIGDVFDQTIQRKRNHYTRNYLTGMIDDLKKGIDPLPFIQKLYSDLQNDSADVSTYENYDRSEYYRINKSYPFEINLLDYVTGGIVSGDLVYIVGRLESGKSTFLSWMVKNWILNGNNVLFISNEMRTTDVIGKIDSMLARFNPLKNRTKKWENKDKEKIKALTYILANEDNGLGKLRIPNKPVRTVDDLQELIRTYKPDIVAIDGVYLMKSDSKAPLWEKLGEISRDIKTLAVEEDVAIVAVTQSNRESAGKNVKVENVSFSDSLGQDADILLAINKENDQTIFLELIKSRFGKHIGLFYRIDYETMDFIFDN